MKALYVFLSWFFLLLSLYYLSRVTKGNGKKRLFAVFIMLQPIMLSVLTGAYLIADWFTGFGFDDSVFYHLRFGVGGAGISEFMPQIIGFVLILSIGIGAAVIYFYLRNKALPQVHQSKSIFFGVSLMVCAFFINPAIQNLFDYFQTHYAEKDFPLYFKPAVTLNSATQPKNILYLYLEGVERTYLDPELFPDLLPYITQLEKKSVSFTQIDQTVGASWTIAGMVASQCGLPLLSVFTNDSFSMTEFMPNAQCLGDMLKQHGYHLEYMGGAKSEFAGKGLFYQSHGFARVSGKKELLAQGADPAYTNSWGIYDDTLYALLAQRYHALSQQSQPFALFSINIGTHQPEGHISRSCEGIRYGDGSNKLLNALHCTDRLVGQLLENIQHEPALKNTLIVLASDHLAPPSVITLDQLKKGERRNLLMFIDPSLQPTKIVREGTTLDITPTLLGYLNYGSHSLALGRDLNGAEPTLREEFGAGETLDGRLLSWRTAIDSMFWGYPAMPAEIKVYPSVQEIELANKRITYPVLITYNTYGKINDLWHSNPKARALTPAYYLVNSLSNQQPFLWIDNCAQIHSLAPMLSADTDKICYFNGSLAGSVPVYGQLPEQDSLLALNTNPLADLSVVRAKQLRETLATTNLIEWSDINIEQPNLPPLPPVILASAGTSSINGPSFLTSLDLAQSGLYLVRMNYRRETDKGFFYFSDLIAPLDVCRRDALPINIDALIKQKPAGENQHNLFYAIIGNGDAACQEGVSKLRVDLPLKQLTQLKTGMPYMAIFDREFRVRYERLGAAEQTIGAYINTNL